jgi:hypothetical protein
MGYRQFFLVILVLVSVLVNAQLYVLKGQRQDSSAFNCILHKELPALCDTFYKAIAQMNSEIIKPFVPDVKFLKGTFDTMDIEFRNDQVIFKHQMILRNLQRDYRKILKTTNRLKINFKKLTRTDLNYDYGKDEKGNQYCYVTQYYQRRKHKYTLSFIAIMLNGYWFAGDELKFNVLE